MGKYLTRLRVSRFVIPLYLFPFFFDDADVVPNFVFCLIDIFINPIRSLRKFHFTLIGGVNNEHEKNTCLAACAYVDMPSKQASRPKPHYSVLYIPTDLKERLIVLLGVVVVVAVVVFGERGIKTKQILLYATIVSEKRCRDRDLRDQLYTKQASKK